MKIELSKAKADQLYTEIGKVRAWLSGFAAGRNSAGSINLNATPPGVDSLRQVQDLLKGGK